jgi:serine/threonine protein kinase
MTKELERQDVTQDLPLDLMPTQTFRPGLVSTISVINNASISAKMENNCTFPKLSINSIESEEANENHHFDIEYKIGQGGFGQVDAATQLCFDRRVAIKRVRSDKGNVFAEQQLKEEAQLMGQLEHPAIPPVHIVGIDEENQIALVMKFIKGNSWLEILKRDHKKIKGNKLPKWYLEKHLNYFLRIGEALDFAHKKSIIHRDIKPENVVIGEYGEVYLIDWGIACTLNKEMMFHGTGYAGTPCYAAPEMVVKKPIWDVRSDVYLMGASLYQIMTSTPPHKGNNAQEVFTNIADKPTPALPDNFPSTLRMICGCAMSKNQEERYTSVYAMLEDVRYFLTQGELSELNIKATQDLDKVRELGKKSNKFSDELDSIGARCRFRLEEINYRSPDNKKAQAQLRECLQLLTEDAVNKKRLAAARALLQQYSKLLKESNSDDDDSKAWVVIARKSVDDLANQLISRTDELGICIQVKLIEEISAQKRAYQDLRSAYINLKKKSDKSG